MAQIFYLKTTSSWFVSIHVDVLIVMEVMRVLILELLFVPWIIKAPLKHKIEFIVYNLNSLVTIPNSSSKFPLHFPKEIIFHDCLLLILTMHLLLGRFVPTKGRHLFIYASWNFGIWLIISQRTTDLKTLVFLKVIEAYMEHFGLG